MPLRASLPSANLGGNFTIVDLYRVSRPVASQPARWGGSELGWVEHQAHPPLGQHPPPLDIARVTSSTYSKGGTKLLKGGTKLLKGGTKLLKGGTKLLKGGTKLLKGGTKLLKGGTKLLKGGTKLLKGGTKLLKGGTKLLKGGTKLLKGGTKLLKGGTKSLGWATGGGSYDPPDPPPPLATGLVSEKSAWTGNIG